MGQYIPLCDVRFVGERAIDVQWKSMSDGSIRHRFPLDINCGSPPNRRTTDTEQMQLLFNGVIGYHCPRLISNAIRDPDGGTHTQPWKIYLHDTTTLVACQYIPKLLLLKITVPKPY